MGKEFSRECDLEGQLVPCQIAQGNGACRQVIECIDANVYRNGDLTPEELCEKFPGMTIDLAIKLREARLVLMPGVKNPLSQFVDYVRDVPKGYREYFVKRALMGILPEGATIGINVDPPKSTLQSRSLYWE